MRAQHALARQLSGERQQRHVPSALDRFGHPPLMPGTRASLPTGADLASIGDQRAQQVDILVINLLGLLGAELADASAAGTAPPTILNFLFGAFFITASRPAFLFHG